MRTGRHHQHGFNLFELMITIAVLAVLSVIAVPSFRDAIRRNQVSSASNTLLASLSYARAEAITRGTVVSVCPSADGANCVDSGVAYEGGWIVYTYTTGKAVINTVYSSAASDGNILLRYTAARPSTSIAINNAAVISFGQQGQLLPANTSLTFRICSNPKGGDGPSSTTTVPGAVLNVAATGSVTNQALAAGSGCTF